MEQRAQTLWSDWGSISVQARSVSPVPVEEDVESFVRSATAMLQADEAVLTLHTESAQMPQEVAAFGNALPQSARAQVAMLPLAKVPSIHGWAAPSSEPDWSTCMLDQRSWHVLRVPVASRRARTTVVLNLLFRTASLADRSRILGKLETLRPMMEPYLRLWQRTQIQIRGTGGLRGALDSIEMGVLLIDQASKIIFANRSAAETLVSGDPLRRNGDGLAASDIRQAVPLQVALSHAIANNTDPAADGSGPRRASILALRSQRLGRSLILSVVPAEERATGHFDAAAIVYIVDPKLDITKQLQPVCELFGLSPVETRLVCMLSAGQTLQDAAKAMRIKDQTARSYLKQIFLKTDTRRQADLVRVMLCSLLRTERAIEPVSLKANA